MQAVSETWSEIFADDDHITDFKIEINGVEYGIDSIVDLTSTCDIFNGSAPVVGQCISARMTTSLYLPTFSIPRRSECKVYARLVLGSTVSEWIEQGTFYIDKRRHAKNGVLSLETYDAMMKGDQLMFTSSGQQETWPKTDIDVVEIIAEDYLGVTIHPDVYDIITNAYEVQYPGYGEGGYTVKQVLGYIGAMYGGNWIIDDNNRLKLLTLSSFAHRKSVPGVLFDLSPTTGILTVTYPAGYDGPAFSLDSTGHIIATYPADYDGPKYILQNDGTISALAYDPDHVFTEDRAEEFDTLIPFQTISRVTINVGTDETTGDPIYYTSGDDSESEFTIECPWGTQEMADALLNQLSTLEYYPYSLTNTVIDPSFEIWDGVQAEDIFTGISCYTRNYHQLFTADISATGEEEIDSEYPYVSQEELQNRQSNARQKASLILTNQTITSEITRTDGAMSLLRQDIDGIQLQIVRIDTEGPDSLSKYLRFTTEGLELGIPDSNTKTLLTEVRLEFHDATGDVKAYIGEDPRDNVYKLFVIKGHIVNELEHGEHWSIITSDSGTLHRLTIKARR